MNKEKSIGMNREEAIKQLKDLIEDRKAFCAGDYDPIFDKDIEALEYAIRELEKPALEVPVQEQFLKEISKGSKTINKVRKESGLEPIDEGNEKNIKSKYKTFMNKEKIDLILKGNISQMELTDQEKEVALKILKDLEGILVIRATYILEFCLKAIQYSKVN